MGFLYTQEGSLMKEGRPILLRGFGLGGWFLPEGYMWNFYTKCDRPRRMEAFIEELCGTTYAQAFWEKYLDAYITEKDIKRIRREGFNSVRLPLNARHLFWERDGETGLNEKILERIDRLIGWCRQEEIYVILDLHGAPGGQTGTNIDDSKNDRPELFENTEYERQLVWLWESLAHRYAGEETVAGYDLLNEPVVNWFRRYNERVLPLYRRLIQAVRRQDAKHLIILEGVHWATDFSIFQDMTKEEAGDGIVLQFHHYWNNPDIESLSAYTETARRLGTPLLMGEGGENNCAWYTCFFPMLEREKINWSFWSYKKMDCSNSPVSFPVPEGWDTIIHCLDGGEKPKEDTARQIFDAFLECIRCDYENQEVWNSLNRKTPVMIPAEAFDGCFGRGREEGDAVFRTREPVCIRFKQGAGGRKPDYKRYGGEPQPEEENLAVKLKEGEWLEYMFRTDTERGILEIEAGGPGELELQTEGNNHKMQWEKEEKQKIVWRMDMVGEKRLRIQCIQGTVMIDTLRFSCFLP